MNAPQPFRSHCNTLMGLLVGLDEDCHDVIAFVTTHELLPFFSVAPFRAVWQFDNDRTVYGIIRNDISPEFNTIDFLRWFLFNETICTTYCKLTWGEMRASFDAHTSCDFCLPSTDPSSPEWDCLKMFMEMYFPGSDIAYGLNWN